MNSSVLFFVGSGQVFHAVFKGLLCLLSYASRTGSSIKLQMECRQLRLQASGGAWFMEDNCLCGRLNGGLISAVIYWKCFPSTNRQGVPSPEMAITPEQQRILEWLSVTLDLPVYAEVYKGALFLLKSKPPGFVTFVAHAGREIMNGLGPTISGDQRSQVQYVQRVNKLQNEWQDEWTGRGFMTPDDPAGGHTIPYDVCQTVRELIDDHKRGRARAGQPESIFFGELLDYETLERVPLHFVQEWKNIKDGFLKFAHLSGSAYEKAAASDIERHFQTLDGLLYVAASSEFERLRGLHDILEETNG